MDVLTLGDLSPQTLGALLARYGLKLVRVDGSCAIPGSYWGEREAGLVEDQLFARPDTPLHSILHEACHYICMSPLRRQALNTNAGGDYNEENAVCYMQVLLADELAEVGRERMFLDMDRWGYTFRLGSAKRWFHSDAGEVAQWLVSENLIDESGRVTWHCRGQVAESQ